MEIKSEELSSKLHTEKNSCKLLEKATLHTENESPILTINANLYVAHCKLSGLSH